MRFFLNALNPKDAVTPNIPIGGIIAIPGTPDLSSSKVDVYFSRKFIPCNGKNISIEDYPDLSALYATNKYKTWGKGDNDTGFRVPDLRSHYLRGAKPDRVTGDRQGYTTARPRGLNAQPPSYPTDVEEVGAGATDQHVMYENKGPGTFKIDADWDNETAPPSVVVDFYVRAA